MAKKSKKNKRSRSKKSPAQSRTRIRDFLFPAAGATALAFLAPSLAQETQPGDTAADANIVEAPLQLIEQPAADTANEAGADQNADYEFTNFDEAAAPQEPEEINPDESADMLNSMQQLKQTYTLKRTINGEVVESTKKTVTFSRDMPYRETEAGQSTVEALKAAFDKELLTRIEAFEEAKLDFTIADANRDGAMTVDEFLALVSNWRETDTRDADAPNADIARQRQYDAFLAEISLETAETQSDQYAREKFAFMAGASETVSREVYIREYLLDFDTMDVDKDTLLRGEELMKFRALNRGEKI